MFEVDSGYCQSCGKSFLGADRVNRGKSLSRVAAHLLPQPFQQQRADPPGSGAGALATHEKSCKAKQAEKLPRRPTAKQAPKTSLEPKPWGGSSSAKLAHPGCATSSMETASALEGAALAAQQWLQLNPQTCSNAATGEDEDEDEEEEKVVEEDDEEEEVEAPNGDGADDSGGGDGGAGDKRRKSAPPAETGGSWRKRRRVVPPLSRFDDSVLEAARPQLTVAVRYALPA